MFEKEAEEYATENWEYYEEGKNDSKELKQAYQQGAEFGYNKAFTSMKEQGLFPFGKWHDLRKDPNDLPLVHSTVLDENSNKVEYIGYGKWQAYSEYYERYYEVDPPIAWCEIPKFEE